MGKLQRCRLCPPNITSSFGISWLALNSGVVWVCDGSGYVGAFNIEPSLADMAIPDSVCIVSEVRITDCLKRN